MQALNCHRHHGRVNAANTLIPYPRDLIRLNESTQIRIVSDLSPGKKQDLTGTTCPDSPYEYFAVFPTIILQVLRVSLLYATNQRMESVYAQPPVLSLVVSETGSGKKWLCSSFLAAARNDRACTLAW